MRGPIGRFKYNLNEYHTVGLIAGGTGITPCLQVIRSCLENETNLTKFILFYQNRHVEDILLKELLDKLIEMYPDRLSISYFISANNTTTLNTTKNNTSNTHNSKQYNGYIQKELIQTQLSIEKCPLVCICGPSGFNRMIKDYLVEMNHIEDESIYIW